MLTSEAQKLIAQVGKHIPHERRCALRRHRHCNCERARLLEGLYALLASRNMLTRELRDFERSFELYSKASRALALAYKRAHPGVPDNVWPDATRVNVWAAERIEQLSPAD